jgi:limonene-1,2-epoxide hydrolase
MTETTPALDSTANARTVETFLYAVQDLDFDAAEAVMAEGFVWQNVGYPTMRGRDRILKMFRRANGRPGFEVKIHRIAAEGDTVLTERTDVLVFGRVRCQFWVCGVFEVHAGQITLWRDYFDVFDLLKGTARGLLGAVIPALRPTL